MDNGMETRIHHEPLEHFLCRHVTKLHLSSLFVLPTTQVDMLSRFRGHELA